MGQIENISVPYIYFISFRISIISCQYTCLMIKYKDINVRAFAWIFLLERKHDG